MKKSAVIFLIILRLAPFAFAETGGIPALEENIPAEYALDDLWRTGLSRSEQVKISEEDIFIAERNRDKALAALLPAATAFGQHTRYSEKKTTGASAGGVAIQPESSSAWGLRLSQSISLGGREITAFGISKKAVDYSAYDLRSVREEYILRIAGSYYDVLKARKGVDIAGANVARLQKYRDEADMRLKVGEVTKTAVLRADAELSGARSDLIRAENILNLAKTVLARIAGIEGNFEVAEPAPGGAGHQDIEISGGVDVLKQTAFSERPEIKSAAIRKNIAGDRVTFARAAYWPNLSLEGTYLRRDENPSSSFFNDESVYALFRIDFPLFEGGLRRAEARESEARRRQADLAYDNLRKTISVEVEDAYFDVQTQAGILRSLGDQLRFARDNYDAVTRQFAFGLASSIDVIDANTLLVDSERQSAMALYDYQFAVLRLKRATGTLLRTVPGG